jgi:hypothetical protein
LLRCWEDDKPAAPFSASVAEVLAEDASAFAWSFSGLRAAVERAGAAGSLLGEGGEGDVTLLRDGRFKRWPLEEAVDSGVVCTPATAADVLTVG